MFNKNPNVSGEILPIKQICKILKKCGLKRNDKTKNK